MADDAVFLGFDFGMRRIGVAVGQSITGSARDLCIVDNRNGRPDWQAVTALVDEWHPDAFVVGSPLTLDGEAQDMTAAAERFGRQLKGRYHLPVHDADERLTTYAARRVARDRGEDERSVDAIAAALILESWMQNQA